MKPSAPELNAWVYLHDLLATALGNDEARTLLARAWAMTRLRPCDPHPEAVDSLLIALEIVGHVRVHAVLDEFRQHFQ